MCGGGVVSNMENKEIHCVSPSGLSRCEGNVSFVVLLSTNFPFMTLTLVHFNTIYSLVKHRFTRILM